MTELTDDDIAAATLAMNDLTTRFRVTRWTVYDWIATKDFPKPLKINQRKARWIPAQVEAWAVSRNHA